MRGSTYVCRTATPMASARAYIFEGPEGSTEGFLISIWSKKVRRSVVLKHGTSQDIAKLAPPNSKNKPRRSYVRLPGVRRKRSKVPRRGYNRQTMVEEVGENVEGGDDSEGALDAQDA